MHITGEQTIKLSENQKKQCIDFANESAKSQQQIEFGSRDTKPRSIAELARDNLIGKLAEVAYANFFKTTFGISVALDFGIYPRSVWDSDDFLLNGHHIDVKATRSGGKWLLVELNKLKFRKDENKLPKYFLFAATGWDRDLDKPTSVVSLKGYASITQICHPERIGSRTPNICEGIKDTLYLPKYSFIPNTHTRLQADNCARSVCSLSNNWSKLIDDLYSS